jgi:ATP-binding cassette subfamily C protein CydCD
VRAPSAVAWCPQDPQLVATSVRENLRIAAGGADDEQLAEGLRAAGLPHVDLDALVGSGGAQLSGGEAQRVALARALLREDARLLLLDEPTAHLDAATSEALLERVHQRWKGATVVHVTHRWSETEHADVVLRVERGGVSVVRDTAPAGAA